MAAKTTVGDRVKVKEITILVGTVRFIGKVKGRTGIWYGVELDEPFYHIKGENKGRLKGISYFVARKQYTGLFVQKQQIIKTNRKNNDALRVTVGDIVNINKFQCYGIIRFIGPTPVKSGIWYGIQLELPKGKNDGSIKQRQYFNCQPQHGIFLKSGSISLLKKSTQNQRPEIIARDQNKLTNPTFFQTNEALLNTRIFLYPMMHWTQTMSQYSSTASELLSINFTVHNAAANKYNLKQRKKNKQETLLLKSQNCYTQTVRILLQPYVEIESIVNLILLFTGRHLLPLRYSVDLMPYFYETVRLFGKRNVIWNKAVQEYKNKGQCSVYFTPDVNIIVNEDIYGDFVSHIRKEFGLRKEYQENALFYIPAAHKFLTVYANKHTNIIQESDMLTRLYIDALCNFDTCNDYAFSLDLVGINYYYYRAPIIYDSGWGSRSRCWDGNGSVLLADGNTKEIKYLCVGDEVAVLKSLPNGVRNEYETAVVKTKIESVVNGVYDMVLVEDKLWITPYHAIVDTKTNEWKMPCNGNKIEQKMVTSIFNFVLDGGHVLCVNGIWACTLGHDLKGDVIENPIWGSSHVMRDMWSKFDSYPNVVEYI